MSASTVTCDYQKNYHSFIGTVISGSLPFFVLDFLFESY